MGCVLAIFFARRHSRLDEKLVYCFKLVQDMIGVAYEITKTPSSPSIPTSTLPYLAAPANFTLSSNLQLKKATVLAESSSFSLVFKLIGALRQYPGISQASATFFSRIYPFIFKKCKW